MLTRQELKDMVSYETENFTCRDCGLHCRRDQLISTAWIAPRPAGPLRLVCPRCQNDHEALKLLRTICKVCGGNLLEHPDQCPASGWAEREADDARRGL